MAASIIAAVGDALLHEIMGNADGFGLEYVGDRSYGQWDDKLDELDQQLRVDVVCVTVPMLEDVAQATRDDVEFRPSYDVVIRKFLGGEGDRESRTNRISNDSIDPLVKLTEDMLLFLAELPLTQYTEASWESSRLRVMAWRKHLREYGQFTSIIRVSYSIVKEQP